MSLINEALKRAKQAPLRPPTVGPELALQPAVYASPTRFAPAWIGPVLATSALLMAVWFLAQWWQRSHETVRMTPLEPAARRIVPATIGTPPAPGPTVPGQSVPGPATAVAAVSLTAAASPASATPSPAAPAASEVATPLVPANPGPEITSAVRTAAAQEETPPVAQPLPTDTVLSSLKLQGIFYRLSQASVLINGHTLFVGDDLDGAKVVAIERQSVHILMHGKTNVLKLR